MAVDVLNQVDPARQVVHAILTQHLGRTDQRQRCTDLVLGVVRNRPAIDAVIERFGRRAGGADCQTAGQRDPPGGL